jgi:hypothetical protein
MTTASVPRGTGGHDLDGLPGLQFTRERFARANFSDDLQLARQIGGANGKSVACGPRHRRIIAIGRHPLGQDSPGRLRQADFLDTRPNQRLRHFGQHTRTRLLKGQSSHKSHCSRDPYVARKIKKRVRVQR